MAEIDVTNQTSFPVATEGVVGVVSGVLAAEEVEGAVDVAFLTESTIAALNERYRGVDGATDVLSYPGGAGDDDWPEPTDPALPLFLGDVLICPAVAERHGREEGLTLGQELLRLLVHGTLHLLGYDHEVDEGEMRMREQILVDELSHWPPRLVAGAPELDVTDSPEPGSLDPAAGRAGMERPSFDS